MYNKSMNYYTLSGKNANKHFGLNLVENRYYDWDYVKNLAEDIYKNEYELSKRDEFHKNILNFQEIIDGRKRREKEIKDNFQKRKINFLPQSYMIRNYIMYNKKKYKDVEKKMYMMKILFENCDILNKWENHKINSGCQVYSFEEKDKFYEDTFNNYVKKNPKFRL